MLSWDFWIVQFVITGIVLLWGTSHPGPVPILRCAVPLAGLKNTICNAGDFLIRGFVISKFHCNAHNGKKTEINCWFSRDVIKF